MKFAVLIIPVLVLAACCLSPDTEPQTETTESQAIPSDRCTWQPDTGPCKAYFEKYYYDRDARACKKFIWGGCGGVVPFDTLEECEKCKQ